MPEQLEQGTLDEAVAAMLETGPSETEEQNDAEVSTEAANGGQAQPGAPGQAEAAASGQEQEDSKTALWRRITEQDRELRALKQERKGKPQGEAVEDLKRQAAENPKEFLARFGITFDKAFELWSNDLQHGIEQSSQSPHVDQSVVKEVQELKQQLSTYKEQQERFETQRWHMEQISRYDTAASQNSDRWSIVNKAKGEGSLELALQVAAKMYHATGQAPDREYVLDCVEETLRNQAQKFASWLPAAKPQVTTPRATESVKSMSKTLGGSSGEDTATPRVLTDEERFALAVAELEK